MLDDLNSDLPAPDRPKAKPVAARAKHDREIQPVVEREPVSARSEHSLDSSVHAWLDGELPEAAVRNGGTAKDVVFWRGLGKTMDRSRLMRTPQHVEAQIMAALPHHAPQVITPWYRREFVVTPVAAVVAGEEVCRVISTVLPSILVS